MEKTTALQLAEWTAGKIYGKPDTEVTSACIDSRNAQKGSLFVALQGESTDGHLYIDNALQAGAAIILSQRQPEHDNYCTIVVPDTLAALQAGAAGYKKQFSALTIGITGSVGKTTTKEFVYAVLCAKYNTLKSLMNLNSETGMPLSVFNLDQTHTAAVFEMGMSKKGEIAALTKIARPDIAVITNIGVSHIEFLGSRENIMYAKLEIERGLKKDGVMILNGDDDMLWSVKGSLRHKTVYYGIKNKKALFRAENIESEGNDTFFDAVTPVGVLRAKINTVGLHNVLNAMAAITAGLYSGISLEDCVCSLLKFEQNDMRQNKYEHKGVTIINDCYNASPDSMKAALTLLDDLQGRKIAVLADMLELGDYSQEFHKDVGRAAAEHCDMLLAFGEMSKNICEGAVAGAMKPENVLHFDSREAASQFIILNVQKGDIILFKGSRGMRTEQILDGFIEGWKS